MTIRRGVKISQYPLLSAKNYLQRFARYWGFRKAAKTVLFSFYKTQLRFVRGRDDRRQDLSILATSLTIAFRDASFALVMSFLVIYFSQTARGASQLAPWIVPLVENISEDSQGAYDSFLITIITVVGIFLTLYLANLSAVIGSLYAELPEKLRNLTIREKVGNVSVEYLVFLTVFSLVLLSAGALLELRPRAALYITSILGVMTIPMFLSLARRAFGFLDPTQLASSILQELDQYTYYATTKGTLSYDPSFQHHYQLKAVDALHGLARLVEVAQQRDSLRVEALARLSMQIAWFFPRYLRMKRQIPTDSRWFKYNLEHLDWYTADITRLQLALATYIPLPPSEKVDHYWLENELFELNYTVLRDALQDSRIRVIQQSLENALRFWDILGTELETGTAIRFMSEISATIIDLASSTETSSPIRNELETIQWLDYLSLLPIRLALGFQKGAQTIDVHDLAAKIAKANWLNSRTAYDLNLPFSVLTTLEGIQHRLSFEIRSERRRISPEWYIQQLVFHNLFKVLVREIEALVGLVDSFYVQHAKTLIASKRYSYALAFLSRGLEYVNKLGYHFNPLGELTSRLETYRINNMADWKDFDWSTIEARLDEGNKSLILTMADCIAYCPIPQRPNTPDVLGQAVNLVSQSYFAALCSKDTELALRLYPRLFHGLLQKHDDLQAKYVNNRQVMFTYIIDPIVDLLELSGYTFVMAEFHQEPTVWKMCEQLWQQYLVADSKLEYFAAISKYIRNPWHQNTAHNLIRTQRESIFASYLREIKQDYEFDPRDYIPRTKVLHPSLLIRMLAQHEFALSMHDPIDIFVDLYLRTLAPDATLDFGGRNDIAEQLKLEQNRELGISSFDDGFQWSPAEVEREEDEGDEQPKDDE